ncbi:hypothetical protein Kisp01_16150 [Kineosporia sp. NBRC 101677]|nr:hypothetical protein Kisp01_16150 [Kineosporia sp. NBRC 101677]
MNPPKAVTASTASQPRSVRRGLRWVGEGGRTARTAARVATAGLITRVIVKGAGVGPDALTCQTDLRRALARGSTRSWTAGTPKQEDRRG